MSEDNDKEKIKVQDRRHFDREGNPVSTAENADAKQKPDTPRPAAEPAPPQQQAPKIDFITVLFSFVHTALIHLGDMPDPATNAASQNLEAAQEMIDILEMLQVKTKGNLNQQEAQYLESALFDLRLRFVEKKKLIK
jgi:hypothetical protein